MSVGTLVRKHSNGAIGVIVKSKGVGVSFWCDVLFYDESIIGCWDMELEVV